MTSQAVQKKAEWPRYRVWDNALHGRGDDTLIELLAIRVAWGFALFKERSDPAFREARRRAMEDAARLPQDLAPSGANDLAIRCVLHDAYDHANQRRLFAALREGRRKILSPSLYLALRVGPTVSASVPIAVLSITIFRAVSKYAGRRATILENTVVQTTGSAGESIAPAWPSRCLPSSCWASRWTGRAPCCSRCAAGSWAC